MPNVSHEASKTAIARGCAHPVVVGFSVRALAEAVAALGRRPIAIDHFTDQDCRDLSFSWYQIVNWGDAVPSLRDIVLQPGNEVGRENNSSPWVLLGGGTENWPELVARLHQEFKVLGPTAEQLNQLRSHGLWRDAVAGTGISFPETHTQSPHRRTALRAVNSRTWEDPISWLIKPMRGAGGYSIARLPENELCRLPQFSKSHRKNSSPVIYQREISGRSLGAHCVVSPNDVIFLGMTESLSAELWPGPSEFIYRGSWGPIAITSQQQSQIKALCRNIYLATGCLGWLQFDFIQDEAGQLWLLEINPRWTAGMEVLFLAGINPVEFHLAAWDQVDPSSCASAGKLTDPIGSSTAQYGKAIVYADRELCLTHENLAGLHALPRENFADLPSHDLAGQVIGVGQPFLTVRARCQTACDESRTRENLLNELQRLRAIALEF